MTVAGETTRCPVSRSHEVLAANTPLGPEMVWGVGMWCHLPAEKSY